MKEEHDPSKMLRVMRDQSKEQATHEDDRRSNRRSEGKTILVGGRELDGSTANQPCRIDPPQRFDPKKVSDGSPGEANLPRGSHSLVAPCVYCFGCGRSGHYKQWYSHQEQGETRASSGGKGASMPQGGASGSGRVRGPAEGNDTDRISVEYGLPTIIKQARLEVEVV